ncbi:MAG: hypothetical protein ACOZBH_04845 [Patescibacteria group bacterium]
MPQFETPPPRKKGEVPYNPKRPADVYIGSGLMTELNTTPEKTPFDESNLMKAKVGDKIKIFKNEKIVPGWEILDIDPRNGDAQVYKDEEFIKINVNDPRLAAINEKQQLSEITNETEEVHEGEPVRAMRSLDQDSIKTVEAMAAIPFSMGDKVKVKRTFGRIEPNWEVVTYDVNSGRVRVMRDRLSKWVKLDKLMEWNK